MDVTKLRTTIDKAEYSRHYLFNITIPFKASKAKLIKQFEPCYSHYPTSIVVLQYPARRKLRQRNQRDRDRRDLLEKDNAVINDKLSTLFLNSNRH